MCRKTNITCFDSCGIWDNNSNEKKEEEKEKGEERREEGEKIIAKGKPLEGNRRRGRGKEESNGG
jgi:hypothetical protein